MNRLGAFILLFCLLCKHSVQANALLLINKQLSAEPVTLAYDDAREHTMGESTNIHIAENEMYSKEGALEQSSLYSNPYFYYDLQTSQHGWDQRDEIYTLSQPVDLSGKRGNNIKIASKEYCAAKWGYEASKRERLNKLKKVFIQTMGAQELLQLAADQQKIAEEFLNISQSKFDAGKISLIEKHKTELTKSLADLTVKQRLADFQNAKKNLAYICTKTDDSFDLVTYPFFETAHPLPLDDYLAQLSEQPEIIRSSYLYEAACHHVGLEKANRIPDVIVSLGYSYSAGDNGVVAEVAIPLPLWNQNQGNIKKARYDMAKAEEEGKLLKQKLKIKLSNHYTNLLKSYQETEEIKNNLLKTANSAFEMALEGYKEGKFDYFDVLESKRSLFEIRQKYIEALINYHTMQAEIEFLNSQQAE